MDNQCHNYDRISCRADTKELFKKCYKVFLKHHPEMKKVFISEDKLMNQICEYYLKGENI